MKRIILLTIALCILIPAARAQTNSCGLQLDVYKFQKMPDSELVALKKVSALLQKADSSTAAIKAEMQNDIPYFENLPAGNYRAVVSTNGYKVTTKEIEFDCGSANDQNVVSEVIFLWEGNIKETVKMNGGAAKIIAADSLQFDTAPLKAKVADAAEQPLAAEQFTAVISGTPRKASAADVELKKIVNGRATYLPKPDYPRAASAVKASGVVLIEVLIDEIGRVVAAKAISGHPLLRSASVKAVRGAKFTPTRIQEMPVQVAGVVVYNFIP